MIPTVLKEVEKHLQDVSVQLSTSGRDTRGDSSQSEFLVAQALQNTTRWGVVSPHLGKGHNRSWHDVKIGDYYCDIKISNCDANDNTNAKKAIFYFLTGRIPDDDVPVQTNKFFAMMKETESPDQNRDYYYLVVNKNNTQDAFIVSLKGLAHCSPSSNNMPFQSNWGKCREPVERSWNEARNFLLEKWAESIRRAIDNHQTGMPKSYPEFFND